MADNTPSGATVPDPTVQDTIRAKRFELIGADGKVAAVLGVIDKHPSDGPFASGGNLGLAILDANGDPQIRLCGRHPGGFAAMEGLTVYTDDGKVRVSINASIGLGGLLVASGLQFNQGIGNFSLQVGSFAGGAPVVRIVQIPPNEPEKELALLTPDTLQLTDANGAVKFEAP